MKPTKKQLNILSKYWTKMKVELDYFYKRIDYLELQMMNDKELGIKDAIFFWSDGEIVGIGNVRRTLKLLQEEDLK